MFGLGKKQVLTWTCGGCGSPMQCAESELERFLQNEEFTCPSCQRTISRAEQIKEIKAGAKANPDLHLKFYIVECPRCKSPLHMNSVELKARFSGEYFVCWICKESIPTTEEFGIMQDPDRGDEFGFQSKEIQRSMKINEKIDKIAAKYSQIN